LHLYARRTGDRILSLNVKTTSQLLHRRVRGRNRIDSARIEEGRLTLEGHLYASLPIGWTGDALLVLKKRHTDDVLELPVTCTVSSRVSGATNDRFDLHFEAHADVAKLLSSESLTLGNWVLALRLALPDGVVDVPVGSREGIGNRYQYGGFGAFTDRDSGRIVIPFFSPQGKLVLTVRELSPFDDVAYEQRKQRALERDRALPSTEHRDAWLITEKQAASAQDNGFAFFRYCFERHPEREVYYVIRSDSPDRERLAPYAERVVEFYSENYFLLLKRCSMLISSDSRNHFLLAEAVPDGFMELVAKKPMLFLQHGVLALKDVSGIYRSTGPNRADRFIVSSEWERDIVRSRMRYPDELIATTGLARWDFLVDKSKKQGNILLMPTWRNWLKNSTSNEFTSSDFFLQYEKLFNSERFLRSLEQGNRTLTIFLHPMFGQLGEAWQAHSGRIRLVRPGETPLNELLMRADLLVTDYSSVIYDFVHMDKPVLFFQFDQEAYVQRQGSYINLATDLPGPVVRDAEQLIDEIEQAAKDGYRVSARFRDRYARAFTYRDAKNCERIFSEALHCETGAAAPRRRIFLDSVRRSLRLEFRKIRRGDPDLYFRLKRLPADSLRWLRARQSSR
jgi:hypothetical protein